MIDWRALIVQELVVEMISSRVPPGNTPTPTSLQPQDPPGTTDSARLKMLPALALYVTSAMCHGLTGNDIIWNVPETYNELVGLRWQLMSSKGNYQ